MSAPVAERSSSSVGTLSSSACTCVVTGYRGHEDELLRLRNSNRERPVTREYLDWRYAAEEGAPEPRIFWLIAPDGQRIGVASAIFRAYWRGDVRTHLAVIGDISLDPAWRGQGLGQLLLRKMTDVLREAGDIALVLPTEAARKSLHAIGWATVGELIPLVLLTDVTSRAQRLLRVEWLAARLGHTFKAFMHRRLRKHIDPRCELQFASEFDGSFNDFWNEVSKRDLVLRDLGSKSLAWRYAQHPHIRYEIACLKRGSSLAGFLVYHRAPEYATCFVYDVVAHSEGDVRCMLAMFASHCMTLERQDSIRVVLGDKHPYVPVLRTLGFLRREPPVPLQVYPATAAHHTWALTIGDKDV